MMTVKVECDCGQPYAFDAEPVNGQLGTSVACPACGADGTPAANEIIARGLAPSPAPPPVLAGASLKVSAPESSAPVAMPAGVKVHSTLLGLVSPEQARKEAAAKISWGDTPTEVVNYLMLQGFNLAEARSIVDELFAERMVTVRKNGIRKIIVGCGMMCVPIIAWPITSQLIVFRARLMGLALGVGLWGVWKVLNGIIALVAPKMESGDVAEH
ncbi:MAG TPA: hypothetical protein VK742_05065 [Candidatus Sulfotelmatobacter sp.]|nr:hypothetical protein [Candidatus Sulfotelmatobacter sp.]